MLNYCDNGVYFESNSAFAVGAEIILGIENSPYSNGTAIFDVYRAKILWRRHVQSTFYTYGYGAQLMSDSSDTMRLNAEVNMRKHPRWNCNQSGEIVRSDPRGVGIRVKRMSDKNGENAI